MAHFTTETIHTLSLSQVSGLHYHTLTGHKTPVIMHVVPMNELCSPEDTFRPNPALGHSGGTVPGS